MTDRALLESKLRTALDVPKSGLIWYYNVGRCVDELNKASKYSKRSERLKTVARKLRYSRASLHRALKFAKSYSVSEIDAIGLPWTVVRVLLAVKTEMRNELQQLASKNRWSARKLQREINARRGKLEPRGGRKRQRKGVREDLMRLAAAAREWQGLATDVWPAYRLRKLRPDGEEIARLVDLASRPMRSLIKVLKKRRLPD